MAINQILEGYFMTHVPLDQRERLAEEDAYHLLEKIKMLSKTSI